MNWHVELIAAKLAAVRAGHIRRLIVSLPPRHLKSHLASVAFPAWCLGHEPSAQILCVSYAQELADKLSRDCRRILASDWYQRLFPTRLAPRHQAVPEFETTAQGSRVATSVGGVLTGRGADLIVIDDPLKPEEALSQAQRQAANEWFDHTLYSRLNDKLTGAIVLIMHRLRESLPSGMTRGTISPAMCWRRSRGRWCVSRRSPMTQRPTGSRHCSGMRMHAQTAMIENGFVHLPKEAGWRAEYLHELTVFPNGKHDDQVPPDTSFRGRPPSCSTGSSRPAASPAASTSITRSSPKSRRPRGPSPYRRWRSGWASSGGDPGREHGGTVATYRGAPSSRRNVGCRFVADSPRVELMGRDVPVS
jgi:hypothetical protein